jgi:glycosyltransferase involved in cell wall biosynthesis
VKILLINSTFWPVAGGIENAMRLQAEELARHGHSVTVLAGQGEASSASYQLAILPELSPSFPLNLQVKRAVDHGQTDKNLAAYAHLLTEKLTPYMAACDLVIAHNAFTTHFNFCLTHALGQFAAAKKTIAWAHDFTPANPDYSMPFTDRMPWSLMYKRSPHVTYVAVSEQRRQELVSTLGLDPQEVPVIPPAVDLAATFGLLPEVDAWRRKHELDQHDLIFYYPSKLLQRKNAELAFEFLKTLKENGLRPLLLLTSPPEPQLTAHAQYESYLKFMPTQLGIEECVLFIGNELPVTKEVWRQMFLLSDVILFPSRYESFGIPRLEAALYRLPCWTMDLPVYLETLTPGHHIVTSPASALREAAALTQDPNFVLRKNLLASLSSDRIYTEKVLPLLHALVAAPSPSSP